MFILHCKINALYCCTEMFNMTFFKHDTHTQVYMVIIDDKIDLIFYKNKVWVFEKNIKGETRTAFCFFFKTTLVTIIVGLILVGKSLINIKRNWRDPPRMRCVFSLVILYKNISLLDNESEHVMLRTNSPQRWDQYSCSFYRQLPSHQFWCSGQFWRLWGRHLSGVRGQPAKITSERSMKSTPVVKTTGRNGTLTKKFPLCRTCIVCVPTYLTSKVNNTCQCLHI